jgi:hypothetical protein
MAGFGARVEGRRRDVRRRGVCVGVPCDMTGTWTTMASRERSRAGTLRSGFRARTPCSRGGRMRDGAERSRLF